jgi:universal stress protein F
MKRVLVAVEASPNASKLLRATMDLVSTARATVSLLEVIEDAGERPESTATLVETAQGRLRELSRNLPPSHAGSLQATAGVAWREICAAAQRDDVDLVVLGAHRHSALERALGTTAAKVINHCDRSVLVVRAWTGPPKRILVALDDSPHATAIREYAVAVARITGGKLRLFRAFDIPSVVPADMTEYPTIDDLLRDAARKALGPHEKLVPPGLRDGIAARHGASAWREICSAARESKADLVVVGSHGCGFSDRLLGTTAEKAVNHADSSVLVVRRPWR